jgi:hypothetical protein
MTTTRLPLFIDVNHKETAIRRHPKLWKKFLALTAAQESAFKHNEDDSYYYELEDCKDEILRKMGLD